MTPNETPISFNHGLGDTVNFARGIPLYRALNAEPIIHSTADKEFIFRCFGATLKPYHEAPNHTFHDPWPLPSKSVRRNILEPSWYGNKPGENFSRIGTDPEADWRKVRETKHSCRSFISQRTYLGVHEVISGIPPYVLFHSQGNTSPERKNLSHEEQASFITEILRQTDLSVLILDWDDRSWHTPHHRVFRVKDLMGNIDLETMAVLMNHAIAFYGIDSGPLHFSYLSDVPSFGLFPFGGHPAEFIIPWKNNLNFVTGPRSREINPYSRFEFQIVESGTDHLDFSQIVSLLSSRRPWENSADLDIPCIHLEETIITKTWGFVGTGLSAIHDRDRTFLKFFEHLDAISRPTIVETGCMRAEEDWEGAGESTVLLARYAQLTHGNFYSFDTNEGNVQFAEKWTRQFQNQERTRIRITTSTGTEGIQSLQKIDGLYLDSLDTEDPRHCEINLEEFQTAEPRLSDKAVVLIDDTPSLSRGKGKLTIPYALSRGWKIVDAGYQVLLSRK